VTDNIIQIRGKDVESVVEFSLSAPGSSEFIDEFDKEFLNLFR